jgi:hypothetical protein
MTLSEQIDELLLYISEGNYIGISRDTPELYQSAVRKMKALGLIVPRDRTYDLAEPGYDVIKAGGFDKWDQAREKKANELHQATLDSAKATVDASESAKWSKYAAIVSAIAAIIAFALPPFLDKKLESTNKTDSTVNVLLERVDTLYLQLKIQPQPQKVKETVEQIQKTK